MGVFGTIEGEERNEETHSRWGFGAHVARLAGDSNSQISSQLYISPTTVKRKLRKIFAKLNVQTRAQAAAEAVRRGLV